MNGNGYRTRLVAVVMCLTVLVVAGVGYSEATNASYCESLEMLRRIVEREINTCEENCEILWNTQNALTCEIDYCWDVVEGEGACPAAS